MSNKKESKFITFAKKYNLNYLIMAIMLFFVKAIFYFVIAYVCPESSIVEPEEFIFKSVIDDLIPFIPYFYVFYLSYYVLPIIFLWLLSFYNKEKFFKLLSAGVLINLICLTVYCFYNVRMDRSAGWEAIGDITISNCKSIYEFFLASVRIQYEADETALNCFPSLHASLGTMLFLIGLPTSEKGHKKFPIGLKIVCIIFGLGIVASTVFVKQHYFADSITAFALMWLCYLITSLIINKFFKNKIPNN